MLCGVGVKSEQMSLEYFAEDGEWFCCPKVGREFVPPLKRQNREEFAGRPLFAFSDGSTSLTADTVGNQG